MKYQAAVSMQVVFKLSRHPVQPFAPEAVEPFAFPEAFHQMRADCVIAADERASEHMLFQDFISESPQSQHLGRVVGAVDAGRDIAALAVTCAGVGRRRGGVDWS